MPRERERPLGSVPDDELLARLAELLSHAHNALLAELDYGRTAAAKRAPDSRSARAELRPLARLRAAADEPPRTPQPFKKSSASVMAPWAGWRTSGSIVAPGRS